ncbi:MAG: alanine racemase [Anaerovoracaceae bacterium]|jgi:alanine racemase
MSNVKTSRSAWTVVDLGRLTYNIQQIQNKLGPSHRIMGVIKANAYGHGSIAVAGILRHMGIEDFAVATLDEALKLRYAGFDENIHILSICPDTAADTLVDNDLSPLISTLHNARAVAERAVYYNKTIDVFVAIDTGMGRIGFHRDDPAMVDEIKEICALDGLHVRGLLTHFANADEADKTFMREQLEEFILCVQELRGAGLELPELCAANSAAVMEAPETWLDLTRPGIILYGEYPSEEVHRSELDLRPVMSVKAKIIRLRRVPTGFTVSYGRRFTAQRPSLIATIPLGYADGLPRKVAAEGRVIIHGHYAPYAGTINMDQCMIDVTDIPDVSEGDTVTILGEDGDLRITATDIARQCDTINYEILCGFGQRLSRVYRRGKQRKREEK